MLSLEHNKHWLSFHSLNDSLSVLLCRLFFAVDLLFVMFEVAEAVFADPIDDKDDDSDDGGILEQLHNHDPKNDLAHMAHISVRALASARAKAFLTTAVTAFVVIGADIVDGGALEATLVLF